MSQELTITIGRSYAKGYDTEPMESLQNVITVTGTLRLKERITVPSASELTVSLSGVPTPGICRIRNLDTANFVKIGPATTVYMAAPLAGEVNLFRLLSTATNLYLRADTAPVDVLLEIYPA